MTEDVLWIGYNCLNDAPGYVRSDQIVALEQCRCGAAEIQHTHIMLLGGKVLTVKNPLKDLLEAFHA